MQKNLLIYHSESYISAKLLARLLNLRAIQKDSSIIRLSKTSRIAIRYGNSHLPQHKDTQFNNPHTIFQCSDSLAFSKFCEKNNILAPLYHSLKWDPPDKFPVLLRKRNHRAGKDIQIIRNKNDLAKIRNPNPYWVPFIPTQYEIRVHYANNHIIKIFLKQAPNNFDDDIQIRTLRLGWHYSIKPAEDDKRFHKAKEIVLQVANLLNLGFGAFDMAWSKELKNYVLWEINTAPGLNQHTAELYAEYLR